MSTTETKLYPYGFRDSTLHRTLYSLVVNKLSNWNEKSVQIFISYLTGLGGQILNSSLKNDHETLFLSHLLSPSAFHLIGISWCVRVTFPPALNLFFWILAGTCANYFMPIHPALIRSINYVLIYTLYDEFLKNIISLKSSQLFLLFFGADYLWGTYSSMPLSYLFSFIIMGNFIFLPDRFSILDKLVISQIQLSLVLGTSVNFIGFLLGYLLSQLFMAIFVLILLYIFIVPVKISLIALFLEKSFIIFLQALSDMSFMVQASKTILSPFEGLNLILIYFIIRFKIKRLKIFVLFFALTST